MRGLNPDQLRALAEVVELGSFTAAARRLNLTQPAISLQIRHLEERLGVKLVERLGKRAFATAPGRELVEHARRMLREADAALVAMHRYREGWLGRVRIGTGTATLIYRLPPVLRHLRDRHPDIDLVITTGTAAGVVERLIDNRIDIGVITLPVDDRLLEVVPVLDEALVAILPAITPDLPDAVTPAYMAEQSLTARPLVVEYSRANIHRLAVQWLTAEGATPRIAMELDNTEAIKAVVAAGFGMAIVPSSAVAEESPGIVVRPLAPPLMRRLAVVHRRDKALEPAFVVVRDVLMTLGERATVPA